MSTCWVRLNGTTPATEIAAHTPPTWETWADGGNGGSSFVLNLSAKRDSHLLKPGTLMEILYGCYRVWLGRVEDFDRTTATVTGRGIQTDALTIPALDGTGAATRNLTTALTTAAAVPWSWRFLNFGLGSYTATGDSGEPLMMGQLLDLIAEQTGKRWGQLPNSGLYLRSDPTVPTWLTSPDSSVFGHTDEGRATHLVGRYNTGAGYATTTRGTGSPARAELVDLTDRGTLTLAQANAILDAALAARGPSRYGLVNGTTLSREQVTTIGGTPAALESVRAGSMVRAHGIAYSGMSTTAPNMVIGKTRYTAGETTIYLEPVDIAPRTLRDVIAAA